MHHVHALTPCSGYDPTKLFQRKVNKRAVPDYYDIIKESRISKPYCNTHVLLFSSAQRQYKKH